jgi:autotransporter passenger strand-loop-strand repeat protein
MAAQTIKLTFSEEMELSYLNLISDKISADISNLRIQSLRESITAPETRTVSIEAEWNAAPVVQKAESAADPVAEPGMVFSSGSASYAELPVSVTVSAEQPSDIAPAAENPVIETAVAVIAPAEDPVVEIAAAPVTAPAEDPVVEIAAAPVPAPAEPVIEIPAELPVTVTAAVEQPSDIAPAADNPAGESASDPVAADTDGPVIESITGYDVSDPVSVTVTVSVSDSGSGVAGTYYTVNGGPWTAFTGSFTLFENCQFMVKAEDNEGNETWSDVLSVTGIGGDDEEGPTIDSITGYDTASEDYVTISVTVSDSGSGVANTYYKFNGSEWKEFTGTFTVNENGPFRIMAEDNAGNQTRSQVLYVKNITRPSSGSVQVYSSGTPILTTSAPLVDYTLSGADYQMQVFSAGKTVSLTMLDSSVATLNAVGTMLDTDISSNAILVMRGGQAERNTVGANGGLIVSDGFAASNAVAGAGASLEVRNSGRVSSTTVSSGGYLVMRGGLAERNTIGENAGLLVSAGTAFSNYISGSNARLEVNDSGLVNSTLVSDGGYLVVRGGQAERNTIGENAGLLVSGGTAVSNYVSGSDARMEANGSGQVSSTVIAGGGQAVLRNGGTMISGQVGSSGVLFVSSGGDASAVSILSGGVVAFLSGATGNSVQFSDGAQVFVSHGASITELNPIGSGYLLQIGIDSTTNVQLTSDGTSYHIVNGEMDSAAAYAGTYLEVANGGCVRNLVISGYLEPLHSGAGGAMRVSAGGSAYNVENHLSGQVNIYSGAYLSGASADTWGEIYVGSSRISGGITTPGGSADNLQIDSDGYLWIHSGGIVSGLQVNMSGRVTVSSGAEACDINISRGHVIVEESNAHVSNVTVDDGGTLQICGASAVDVTILSGGILTYSSSFYPMDVEVPTIALSGQASHVTISSGGVLAAKFTGSATTVHALGGAVVQVSSGALVRDLTADSGAAIYIESQGQVREATVGGLFAVKVNASAYNVQTLENAEVQIQNGAYMEDLGIASDVVVIISGGGQLNSATVSSGATVDIHAGATARNLAISEGAVVDIVYSNGMLLDGTVDEVSFSGNGTVLSGYTILNSGHLNMLNGSAHVVTASSGGRINISSGATATEVTVVSAGSCYVYGSVNGLTTDFGETHFYDTGYGINITVNGGYAQVHEGSVIEDVTINNSATLIVRNGGQAGNVTISSGGLLAAVSGGTATDVDVLGGANVQVSSGALVQGVSVAAGAHAYIESHGRVQDAAVNGGQLAVKVSASAVNVNTLSGAEVQVQSGASLVNLNLNAGAYTVISGGGQLNSARVSSGGQLDINASAAAQNLTINPGAVVNIDYTYGMQLGGTVNTAAFSSSGGILSGYTILNSGHLNMLTGSAQAVTVSSGGRINVSSGAWALDVTVASAGICYVYGSVIGLTTDSGETHFSSDGTGVDITVAGGYAQVHDDATITSVTINDSATLIVRNGGRANDVTVSSGGLLATVSGGYAAAVDVLSGANVQVSSGTLIQSLDLKSGAHAYVESMGQVQVATVRGLLAVKGYGSAQTVSALASGEIQVLSNGYLENLYLEAGAYTVISGGGSLDVARVSSGGQLDINAGAVAHNLTVNPGAVVNINYTSGMQVDGNVNSAVFSGSDEFLSGYTVLSGGHLNMLTGSAQAVTVSSGGRINISSGASAADVTVASAGSCYVYGNVSGLVTDFGETHFYNTGYGIDVTVNGGYAQVHEGSEIEDVTINVATLIVRNGGHAGNVTVSSGGVLAAISGGSASDVNVLAGANVQVSSGTLVQSLNVETGAHAYIESQGQVQDATVNGGQLVVKGFASAVNVNVLSGAGVQVLNSAYIENLNLNAGAYTVISGGGELNSATVLSGAILDIQAGAAAHDITVSSGALNIVYSNGMLLDGTVDGTAFNGNGLVLSGLTVLSGGHLDMQNGSAMVVTASSGGRINISSGAMATDVTVAEAGICYVFGTIDGLVTTGDTHIMAGSGSNLTVTGSYTQVHGGSIDQVAVGTGAVIVYAGGSVSDVTMTSAGVLAVNGGSASDVKVSSGGQTQVNANGSVSQLQIFEGGYSNINAATGSVDGAEVTSGAQLDVYSGVLQNANVSGRLNILAAGSAQYVTVASGAVCNINGNVQNVITFGDINFNAGATVSSVEVMGDFAEVNASAAVEDMVVSGGQVIVRGGGVVQNLTLTGTTEGDIFTGGAVYGLDNNYFLRMQSGSILGGEINLTETGRVFANEGAVIEFTLVGRSISDDYLVNNLSRIQWSPSFAVSVSSDQAVGTYKLARGVSSFTGSMTVTVDSVNVGTIACNDSFSYGGYTYTLTKSNVKNDITFSVALAGASPASDESSLLSSESAAAVDLGQNWQEPALTGAADSPALDPSDYGDEISSLLGMQYSEDMTAYYACGDLTGWNETASILDKNRSLIA